MFSIQDACLVLVVYFELVVMYNVDDFYAGRNCI